MKMDLFNNESGNCKGSCSDCGVCFTERDAAKLHEECGVFGIYSYDREIAVAPCVYHGLVALQHRGQESCGIVVNDDGLFASHKDLGLVSEVFTGDTISSLPKGTMAVVHTACRPG